MAECSRVCPWWVGYVLINPLRRFAQNPVRLLAPYVHAGMTVLEPGPGMGFFTLELARLVGPAGRVIAVDVEPRMIGVLQRRARRTGLSDRIDGRVVRPASMGLDDLKEMVDFVLAWAVGHEMPVPASFFAEATLALKPRACLLFVEPRGHVSDARFTAEVAAAAQAGLYADGRPSMRGSHAVLLRKPAG